MNNKYESSSSSQTQAISPPGVFSTVYQIPHKTVTTLAPGPVQASVGRSLSAGARVPEASCAPYHLSTILTVFGATLFLCPLALPSTPLKTLRTGDLAFPCAVMSV